MRAATENWLLRHWYSRRQPPWYLRLIEPVYALMFLFLQKRGASSQNRCRSKLPLVVVGNITAGGSGKTPLVIRLCQLALEMNLKPGIASTGYGRNSKETLMVKPGSDAQVCGDEPVLLAERTGVPVVVANKRFDAIRKLNEMNLDLLISDDGLQTADLERDMEICVLDGARGLGNGHLLPAGPLREPASRLRKVDFIISNGVWKEAPDDFVVYVMLLEASKLVSLDGASEVSIEQFRQTFSGKPVHAIAGIGHPQRFFKTLEALGIEALTHSFPDHHRFKQNDFNSFEVGSSIIMTEKDAVKCRALGIENAWYLPVETHLPADFETIIKDRFRTLIKEHK